jgi:hypothetical protein
MRWQIIRCCSGGRWRLLCLLDQLTLCKIRTVCDAHDRHITSAVPL